MDLDDRDDEEEIETVDSVEENRLANIIAGGKMVDLLAEEVCLVLRYYGCLSGCLSCCFRGSRLLMADK